MTLLTYAGKYVLQSTGTVQTTSTSYGDDNVSQTFTLYGTKTVLAIYAANTAHGNTNAVGGIKNAISIDGADHSEMCQSAYAANYSFKNTCVWVGSLAAGSHTIKGRLACNEASTTCNLTNRTLIIFIFDGDEFDYVEDATAVTAASTTLANDSYATVTRTPSAACKALCFYGVTNVDAVTERYAGKKIQLTIGGTARTDSLMGQAGTNTSNNADSVTTAFALSLTATSTTFQGQFAGNAVQTVTISKRFMCCLYFADDTLVDTDYDSTSVSSTTTVLADDSYISITRAQEGELLCLYVANKASGTSSAIYGTHYGIMLDSVDVADSRSTPSYSADAQGALVAYASTVSSGSHTIKGRYSTNYSTTAAYVTSRQMIALWFPVKTPLTYKDKYIIQSGSTVTSSGNTLADDTAASKTFTLSASQTVLVFYNANSTYGDTNNVGGFKNAISVDGSDYAIMQATGYAANYPMRNACVWVGTLASGEHTIKGRFASNNASTNTSITNRTLMIYIFDGDDYRYVDSTTTQALAASETYADDTAALFSVTPKENSKALVLYGVTNAPATSEHYVGKKVCVAVNGTDYTDCEARQSSYSTGGSNPDSVATAYALALTGSVNYVFKGRAASVYTYATYISRRFFAILVLSDTTLIDVDASSTSENTASESLVDDPDISITRSTLGELIAFYAATKTSFTTSDIQGNRYGLMFDGFDVAHSRTSQAYSGSANSCLVGMGSTVFDQSHTVKGRFSANEDTGTVYITNRCLTTLWLERAVVNKNFSGSNDIDLIKAFAATNDLSLSKAFESTNAIIAQTLINKIFEATNDIQLSKPFAGSNDLHLSKAFQASLDISLSKAFGATVDIRISKEFASALDIRLSKAFSSSDDVRLSKAFSSINDEAVSGSYGSSNDLRLSSEKSSSNDVRLYKTFTATNDILALYVLLYASSNDINLFKAFSATSDIKVIKAFQTASDVLCSKIFSASNDLYLIKSFSASNDLRISSSFASTNEIFLTKIFSSSNEILGIIWTEFASTNSIMLSKSFESISDIGVAEEFDSTNDIKLIKAFLSTDDILLHRIKSSRNDVRLSKTHTSRNDIRVNKIYSSHNTLWYYSVKSSSNDIKILKNFTTSNSIDLYKALTSYNDVFVTKHFSSDSKLNVDRYASSSNNILLEKSFESMNDVLEFLEKLFASSNMIMLAEEFENTSDIRVNKTFSSENIIIRVIWDLNYPLTVVVSQDERTIVLTAITRKVYINNYNNSVIVGATKKTVTVDQPDRSVSVTKW